MAGKATAAPATEQYIVTGAAVVMTTGRKANGKPETTRLTKGTIINAPVGHPAIADFVRARTVAPYTPGQAVRPATVRTVTKAFGSAGDPVAVPKTDVIPTPVSNVGGNAFPTVAE